MASAKLIVQHFLRRSLIRESRRCHSLLANNNQLSAETVLAQKNRESCIKKLKLYPKINLSNEAKEAAVLVPLCMHNGELGFLYTLRSHRLNSSGGQVSFPGGKKDETDKSLEETALRETWEELRIPKDQVDVWSETNELGRKKMRVKPILGYIGEIEPEKLDINQDEVKEAFVISLENLCDPKHFHYTQFRGEFILPSYTGGKYRVWGLTGMITHMMLKALLPHVYKNELRQFLQI